MSLLTYLLLAFTQNSGWHRLFHTKENWSDEVLDRLEGYPIDQRLVDFSTKVVLISQLRQLIDTVYDRSTPVAKALITTMDEQEYLQDTYLSLESLIKDRQFLKDLAQVQSRSIHEELSSVPSEINYTFKPKDVWQKCDYIFANSSLLLREENQLQENADTRRTLLGSLKTVAQSFEFLSKFADKEVAEILLINSAICYHIAGYHANAQCITKVLGEKYRYAEAERVIERSQDLDTTLAWFFRIALFYFLKRDIIRLQRIAQQATSYIQAMQEKFVSDSEEEPFIPNIENLYGHLFFQKALFNFTEYCKRGTWEDFKLAQKNIEKSHASFQRTGDVRLDIIASELRTVLKLFIEQSTWENIEKHGDGLILNPLWSTYLRNLAVDKSIVEFWTAQLKALQGNLLTSDDSFIIQMPTSAGKTFIAELAILSTLTKPQQKRCLYIAPYRALVNEVETRLADTLGALGFRVSNLMGGFEFDILQNFLAVESDVLVTTPEKADLLFRTRPEYFKNLATIVVDEGHILDEGVPGKKDVDKGKTLAEELAQYGTLGRGTSLELLITRLKKKLPDVQFLFLSAVMPEVNVDDFVSWLSKNAQKPLKIERTERPSRQTIASFTWHPVSYKDVGGWNGQLEYYNAEGRHTYVPYFLKRERFYTGGSTPTGLPQTTMWPDAKNKAQTTAMLAATFAQTGPVLVFCATTTDVRTLVENIIISLHYRENANQIAGDNLKYKQDPYLESFDLAKEWLGDEHPLTRALHYGVGLHYGPLPDPVRQAVENDFRDGKITILVSTTTLGQGVNLPVKTAIIYSLERRFPDPTSKNKWNKMKTIPVKKRDFWNMCGRAGRAGKETEGLIVFVNNSDNDDKLFKTFSNENNIEVVESPLYKLLEALSDKRISQKELIDYLDPHILALLAEEVIDTEDEKAISEFLQKSLVGVQATRNNMSLFPLTTAMKRTSTRIHQEVTDKALRAVFSTTGLRVKSCLMLEHAVDAFLSDTGDAIPERKKDDLSLDKNLLEIAFKVCQELPEMQLARNIKPLDPHDELQLVHDWVEGKPVNEIRSKYWTPEQEDEFGLYVADRLIYKMPWGFNGFLRILAFKLQKEYDDLPLSWQYLPSMMKFGVNSVFASWMGSFGVSSRQLAFALAQQYPHADDSSFYTFIKWLVNLPFEFLFKELHVGSVVEKKRFVQKINKVVADSTLLQVILERQTMFETSVQGIPYENRAKIAALVHEGDKLVLEAELDNQYDPSAISVLFEGKQIGYIKRDTAKIISKEMQSGREFRAVARAVKPPILNYPYPHIELTITG